MYQSPLIAARLAALSPAAFAQTKAQLRAEARERFERTGAATEKIATDIWAAEPTAALHPRLRGAHAQESLARALKDWRMSASTDSDRIVARGK